MVPQLPSLPSIHSFPSLPTITTITSKISKISKIPTSFSNNIDALQPAPATPTIDPHGGVRFLFFSLSGYTFTHARETLALWTRQDRMFPQRGINLLQRLMRYLPPSGTEGELDAFLIKEIWEAMERDAERGAFRGVGFLRVEMEEEAEWAVVGGFEDQAGQEDGSVGVIGDVFEEEACDGKEYYDEAYFEEELDEAFGEDALGDDAFNEETFGEEVFGMDAYNEDTFGNDTYHQDAHHEGPYHQDAPRHDAYHQNTYHQNYHQDAYHGDVSDNQAPKQVAAPKHSSSSAFEPDAPFAVMGRMGLFGDDQSEEEDKNEEVDGQGYNENGPDDGAGVTHHGYCYKGDYDEEDATFIPRYA